MSTIEVGVDMGGADRPSVLIVVEGELGERLCSLFARRGFQVVMAEDQDAVRAFARETTTDPASSAAILDLRGTPGVRAMVPLAAAADRPLMIGIVDRPYEFKAVDHLVDSVFAPPLDPALLFAEVVKGIAARRAATGRRDPGRQARLTGLIGKVDGNELFRRFVEELEAVILPVNAGAILEKVVADAGTTPFQLTSAEAQSIVDGGQLASVLRWFVSLEEATFVMDRLRAIVAKEP
jgi:NAD(P)-dependent dehydrogenase (short-subunit alcohol dehydrogenase family)